MSIPRRVYAALENLMLLDEERGCMIAIEKSGFFSPNNIATPNVEAVIQAIINSKLNTESTFACIYQLSSLTNYLPSLICDRVYKHPKIELEDILRTSNIVEYLILALEILGRPDDYIIAILLNKISSTIASARRFNFKSDSSWYELVDSTIDSANQLLNIVASYGLVARIKITLADRISDLQLINLYYADETSKWSSLGAHEHISYHKKRF